MLRLYGSKLRNLCETCCGNNESLWFNDQPTYPEGNEIQLKNELIALLSHFKYPENDSRQGGFTKPCPRQSLQFAGDIRVNNF
jgi:hypothetical protein